MYKFLIFLFLGFYVLTAQTNQDCLDCHDDPEFTTERNGREVSLHVNQNILLKSVHADHDCIDCHTDASEDHPEDLKPVDCGDCHDDAMDDYMAGVHGQAFKRGEIYAPTCKECHGTHDILSPKEPKSRTYKMNIPLLCGKCHREGAPVARTYNIGEHNIIENYTQSIHGAGLFKAGLTVTATCNNCHGNHLILPHTNPNSSISLNRIAETCMTCHARIEEVHVKVIKGELWEEKPGAIPACTDCHPPHKVNRQNIVEEVADRTCLRCHAKQDVHKVVDGKEVSLHVDKKDIAGSIHREIPCVKCHSDVSTHLKRPCETANKVDCSNCHAEVANLYFESGHGEAYFRKDENAPYCTDCHGDHKIKSKYDETAKTYRASIPSLCGECHKSDGKASQSADLKEVNAIVDYSKSVHGRGLMEKGLLPSAVCTDCHTAHHNLKDTDERSTVYPDNIPATCATCHRGIYKEYATSIHAIKRNDNSKRLPTCADCHSAHTIMETKQDRFMTEVTQQCGSCHEELAETYLQTIHGKSYELGNEKVAKCSDCHGAHKILGVDNPASTVSAKNIVTTCQNCHEDANTRFTGYLTHATHHDKAKYPVLYYTYWLMTSLLIGVFGFFGIHTLLWLPRSIQGIKERQKEKESSKTHYYIKRFSGNQRWTHLFVIFSFMALALTGMVLKFANMEWAKIITNFIGGAQVAAVIHRFAAIITFGYFSFHVVSLIKMRRRLHKSWFQFIFGKDSMMFNLQDLKDFGATIKWFFGLGKRPDYGRWTYWEKFDYFAVFWGVAVIGFSGLMLWFPEFFTQFMPGWLINIAHIIHSDEALLAVGFIFTVHFFNTHFRPEAFPVDTVIFTGLVSLEEFKRTRPREYEELKNSGQLRKKLVKKEITPQWERSVKIFGLIWLALGVSLIVLIIYSVIFGYQ
ncbi:MAG: cytochrome c3 family protein [Calditrichae bacterium]|nr:cytochrome c3 family protein [Calditrichota bacterium]MCB9058256.1 cytochrome c3 family protein [Calditrichia bacterium]